MISHTLAGTFPRPLNRRSCSRALGKKNRALDSKAYSFDSDNEYVEDEIVKREPVKEGACL